MKKLFCFLAVASTALFTSCSDDDSGDNNTNPPVEEVTGITLTANSATGVVGDQFTFTVKNNLNANVTSASTIYVNDAAITGSTYTATTVGTYTVHAVNGDFTSPDVTITVTEETIEITSLEIAYDNQVVTLGDAITFTATANDNLDVTAGTTFLINGEAIEGNVFTATTSGVYEVTASYEGVETAEALVVAAIGSVNFTEANLTKTALIYTGVLQAQQGNFDYWQVFAYNSNLNFDEFTQDNFPTTYVVYDIVVPVTTPGTMSFPNAETAFFNTISEVVVDGVAYPVVSVDFEGANFGFTSDITDESATTIAYSVDADFNSPVAPSTLNINFDGAYSGWYNLSEGEGRSTNPAYSILGKKKPISSFKR